MDNQFALFGIFKTQKETKSAIRALVKIGVQSRDLTTFSTQLGGSEELSQGQKNQIANGTLIGSFLGITVMACLSLYLTTNEFLQPSLFNSVVFGKLFIVTGFLFLGTVFGADAGALVGIGTPFASGKRYGQYLKSGGILLSVRIANAFQFKRIKHILIDTGGQDVQYEDEEKVWKAAIITGAQLQKPAFQY